METISVLINDLVAPAYNSNVTHWTDHWKMGWPPIVLFATVVHINSKGYFFPKKKTFTKCEHHLSMTEFIVHSTTSNSQIIQLKYIFLKKVQVLLFCIVLGLTTILFFEEQSGVRGVFYFQVYVNMFFPFHFYMLNVPHKVLFYVAKFTSIIWHITHTFEFRYINLTSTNNYYRWVDPHLWYLILLIIYILHHLFIVLTYTST